MACGDRGEGFVAIATCGWVVSASCPGYFTLGEKCLWYPVGWVSPIDVVVLEKVKIILPPTGKRTPFLAPSFFCVVTALTELSRLSSLLKEMTVLKDSGCPPSPHSNESPFTV